MNDYRALARWTAMMGLISSLVQSPAPGPERKFSEVNRTTLPAGVYEKKKRRRQIARASRQKNRRRRH